MLVNGCWNRCPKLPRDSVPNLHRLVVSARAQEAAVAREGHRSDSTGVGAPFSDLVEIQDAAHLQGSVTVSSYQRGPIRGKRDFVSMPPLSHAKRGSLLFLFPIPYGQLVVQRAQSHKLAVR